MWDKAFRVYFDDKVDLKFTKGLNLMEFEEGPIAIKRVAYRYSIFFPFHIFVSSHSISLF